MAIAGFVIFGMIAVPLGAARGWPFVTAFAWRAAHALAAAAIALQKVLGQTCFLSVWEFRLMERASLAREPISPLHGLAISVMHWNMPLWFFTALYVAVFIYILWLWRRVPPRPPMALRRLFRRTAETSRSHAMD